MFLIKKINYKLNEEVLLSLITTIDEWTPWVITRKNKWGHINFDYNGAKTNCKMYSAFLSDYWDLFLSVEPRLSQFKPNLKKSWIKSIAFENI